MLPNEIFNLRGGNIHLFLEDRRKCKTVFNVMHSLSSRSASFAIPLTDQKEKEERKHPLKMLKIKM